MLWMAEWNRQPRFTQPGDKEKMISLQTKQNRLSYSDAGIQAEIWKAVRQDDGIRAVDMGSFSVSVKEGFVLLAGHVSKTYHRELIEEAACSIPGLNAVHNNLIVDSNLTIQVAERLSRDERTRLFIFPVGSAHGWVRLGGVVPRRELQRVAEEIAAQEPSVRGVLSRPRVIGEYPETERQPIQPQIQSKLYDYNRHEGVVTQVVIQPRNRLVTHAVVSASGFQDGMSVFYEYLVPVDAMEVVNNENVFLKRKGPPLNAYPAFEASDYMPAPVDWQPPYPYPTGTVRWPCEQSTWAKNKSISNRLFRRQR
jgi:osmotically-inducible protein OsmY